MSATRASSIQASACVLTRSFSPDAAEDSISFKTLVIVEFTEASKEANRSASKTLDHGGPCAQGRCLGSARGDNAPPHQGNVSLGMTESRVLTSSQEFGVIVDKCVQDLKEEFKEGLQEKCEASAELVCP